MARALRLVPAEPGREEAWTLGMPELGLAGLSEPWLRRRLGDLHWRLIADAIGSAEAVFRDAEGAPVYAAFCAISIEIDRPETPRLGARLGIAARLSRLSPTRLISTRLISHHALASEGAPIGRVRMISAFLAHDATGRNRALRRAAPQGLPALAACDDAFAGEAAAIVRGRTLRHLGCPLDEPPAATLRLRPAPQDFNAARLLYFPSYPALADRARWDLGLAGAPRARPYRRDILYLGNLDLGEETSIAHGAPHDADGRSAYATRLSRTDGAPLALIVTRRAAGNA